MLFMYFTTEFLLFFIHILFKVDFTTPGPWLVCLISIIFIHILAFYSNDRMHFHTLIKIPGTQSSFSFKQPEGDSVQWKTSTSTMKLDLLSNLHISFPLIRRYCMYFCCQKVVDQLTFFFFKFFLCDYFLLSFNRE
jgi:hypothetical protein